MLLDEMKIREDLVFDRSGDVIGFVNVGDITNKIRALEAQCNGESEVNQGNIAGSSYCR